jgi:GrpB-like predicted nucleotidyltransferase (UPF0157 family)
VELEIFGPPQPGPVTLVEWDPAWPERFEREAARIRSALGPVARRVEHIGSTSVEGLAAKPVVDILLTVADADAEADFVPALEAAGYVLRVREPRHRMLRTPDLGVHVHVYADDDPECARCLVFRDRLRTDTEDRAAYERLKRELAVRDWADRQEYADAKGELVEAIIARGRTSTAAG